MFSSAVGKPRGLPLDQRLPIRLYVGAHLGNPALFHSWQGLASLATEPGKGSQSVASPPAFLTWSSGLPKPQSLCQYTPPERRVPIPSLLPSLPKHVVFYSHRMSLPAGCYLA